jgi:glycosyltransferase involved in cell wall biosynthesis
MALEGHGPIRVLLLAEACNPRWASVPLEGYNYARALTERKDLQVTLVTHVRNRAALEADAISGMTRIVTIDNELVARPFSKLSRWLRSGTSLSWTTEMALAWPSYMVFERMVYRRFADALRRGEFGLIHRVTPVSPTLGSPLASLTKQPMIVGPLNGGLPWPKEHPGLRSRERELLVPLRPLYKQLPYYRSTYRHLAAVIAGSRHTASEIPTWFQGRRYYLPENGIDPARFSILTDRPAPGPRFRFVTVGRLVPYKGMDLILEAMGRSDALRGCELRIIGDGPQRTHLESLAGILGLAQSVTFLGWRDQRDVGRELREAQAFVFPSLREFGGAVVLEAMASGLPVIVVDYGGPGELATSECGLKLPMAPRESLIPDLKSAMERLASDVGLCQRLGDAAKERACELFTWPKKANQIVEIYRDILSNE